MKKGRLLLIPTPLDHGLISMSPTLSDQEADLNWHLPKHTLDLAASCQYWICENAKSARAFIKRLSLCRLLPVPLQEMNWFEMPRDMHKQGDHDSCLFDQWAKATLQVALKGHDIAVICEAGMPAIADPGSSIVRQAHRLGLMVSALPGPISLMQALACSGLNGQSFAFHGYLPLGQDRLKKIKQLDTHAHQTGQAQLCIETPYRNAALIEQLLQSLRSDTRLAISGSIGTAQELTYSAPVSEWKNHPFIEHKGPAVFMWGKDSNDLSFERRK